jgi:hypothetical protein
MNPYEAQAVISLRFGWKDRRLTPNAQAAAVIGHWRLPSLGREPGNCIDAQNDGLVFDSGARP